MGRSPDHSRSAWDIDRRGLRFAALAATVLIGLATVVASNGVELADDATSIEQPAQIEQSAMEVPEAEDAQSEPRVVHGADDADEDPSPVAMIVLAIGAVLLVFGAVAWLVRRRDDPVPEEDEEVLGVTSSAEAIDLLAELLHPDTGDETPRQTIVRMYAALESGLGRPHLARRPHETPGRFVRRILGNHEALRGPLRDLVGAFEVARFSEHPVSETMRQQALAALASTRSHYAMHEVQSSGRRTWAVHRQPTWAGR